MADFPPLFVPPPAPPAPSPAAEVAATLTARGHILLSREGRLYCSEATRLTPEDRHAITARPVPGS